LEEELLETKKTLDEQKMVVERDLWKVTILEIVNQLVGSTLYEHDKHTFKLFELTTDRVKLQGYMDIIYKNHWWNNIICHTVQKVSAINNIEFSKQEYITMKKRLKDEQRKRKHIHNLLQELKGNIRVCVRVRKLIPRETKG